MSSPIPASSADMKELRKVTGERQRSRSASLGREYAGNLDEILMAINEKNGLPRRKVCCLLGTSRPQRVHMLPHSDHRTLRQHQYLYYAGLLPRAGCKEQQQFKGSAGNICWLSGLLHSRMDESDAFVWMAELEQVIETCEQHLARIERDGGHGFETFQSSSFLQDWPLRMDMPETEGRGLALYSYRAWVLPYRTREDHQDDQIGTIGASQIRSYVVSREFLAYPPPSPFKYTPPLPTRLLGLDPFVTTLMAKTTLERRPDYSDIAFDDEAKVTLQRAEYLLELCEVETPSSWRDLARPPLGNTLPQGPVDSCLQRRRYQATKYKRQQQKRGRPSGEGDASSSPKGPRGGPRFKGEGEEGSVGHGQLLASAAVESEGGQGSGAGGAGAANDVEQGVDAGETSGWATSAEDEEGYLPGRELPDLSPSATLSSGRTNARGSSPITPPPQWNTSSLSKWAHSAEADLTLGGIAALTMQEHLDDEGCGCDGATLDELEAKLERFEAACEAQRTAVLVECTRIIERHFSADCAKRGFALAMRSLRSTAKHAADDELAAKQEMQEKQDERSRQHRDKIIDAINELGY